jgi:hypothetical protein
MQPTVESIVRAIPTGLVFDSHYVIDTLIKDHSDIYLRFAAQTNPAGQVTEYIHAQIAGIIRDLGANLVTRPGLQSWSYTIHGTASKCELWQRA